MRKGLQVFDLAPEAFREAHRLIGTSYHRRQIDGVNAMPADTSFLRIGCEGCPRALYQAIRGERSAREGYINSVKAEYDPPYDAIVSEGLSMGTGGRCDNKDGGCWVDRQKKPDVVPTVDSE